MLGAKCVFVSHVLPFFKSNLLNIHDDSSEGPAERETDPLKRVYRGQSHKLTSETSFRFSTIYAKLLNKENNFTNFPMFEESNFKHFPRWYHTHFPNTLCKLKLKF